MSPSPLKGAARRRTWREQADLAVAEAMADLPPHTPLEARIRILDEARPWIFGASWPRRAWRAARRAYLVRFGYRPRQSSRASAQLPLFPEEEAPGPAAPPAACASPLRKAEPARPIHEARP